MFRRDYELVDDDGLARVVTLVVSDPAPYNLDWVVSVEIHGLAEMTSVERLGPCAGIDELSATLHALEIARVALERHPAFAAGRLGWPEARDGLGLELRAL